MEQNLLFCDGLQKDDYMPPHSVYIKNIKYYNRYSYSDKNKLIQKKYRESENGKLCIGEYRQKHKKETSDYNRNYRQSERGKIIHRKSVAKVKAKRRKNLGFIPMFDNPFADLELIEYHHITDIYVVALPKDMHHLYLGKQHRENTMTIVKQIYLDGD